MDRTTDDEVFRRVEERRRYPRIPNVRRAQQVNVRRRRDTGNERRTLKTSWTDRRGADDEYFVEWKEKDDSVKT